MAFLDIHDIRKLNRPAPSVEITATLRTDRLFLTPNGPVWVLRPGEQPIEFELVEARRKFAEDICGIIPRAPLISEP